MKENTLEYKGYHTKVHYCAEDGTFRGIIEGINDYVDFQTNSMNNVEKEFHSVVDDYLEFCKEIGKKPERRRYNGRTSIKNRRRIRQSSS